MMDYETAFRCFIEMKDEGEHCEDVASLLMGEVQSASELSKEEVEKVIQEISAWEKKINRSDRIKNIKSILLEIEGFKVLCGNYFTNRLLLGRHSLADPTTLCENESSVKMEN